MGEWLLIYDLGYRLRKLRLQKRLTQEQVGRLLGLSKASISGYENNVKLPSIEILRKLSALYGVTADYLLGLDDRAMLCIDGLTRQEQEILQLLVTEFRTR